MMSKKETTGPRYLAALANERLTQIKQRILDNRVEAKSRDASTVLFEAAEAAALLMSDRAATLHALAYVDAFGLALDVEVDHDVRAVSEAPVPPSMSQLNYEALTDGSDDLEIVDAALMLARGSHLEGFSSSQESARACLTSHGLSRETLLAPVVPLSRKKSKK
jgi:hypothetical protein